MSPVTMPDLLVAVACSRSLGFKGRKRHGRRYYRGLAPDGEQGRGTWNVRFQSHPEARALQEEVGFRPFGST